MKRSGPFSEPPDSENWKVAVLIPFPKISSYHLWALLYTHAFKRCLLECKRKPKANTTVVGMLCLLFWKEAAQYQAKGSRKMPPSYCRFQWAVCSNTLFSNTSLKIWPQKLRWPNDSQRESGWFARIDSHESIRRETPCFYNVWAIRANRLKPAIHNFGGIPNSTWNYNSHETTTLECSNSISTSWGPKAVTAVKWLLLHRAIVER